MPGTLRRRGQGNSSNGSGRLSGHEQSRPSPPPLRHSPLPTTTYGLPALDAAFWPAVEHGLEALAVPLSPGLRAAIEVHAQLLLAWNAAINLTALRTAEAVAYGHVIDSLSALNTCRGLLDSSRRPVEQAGLIDLGSGGGFPGLPLAFALGVGRAALVDSVHKKARFLAVAAANAADAASRTGAGRPIDLVALAERAEDLADEPDHREAWDLVVARAVGSVAEVVELGLPLAAIGGHVVAWKRDTPDQPVGTEIDAARRVIKAGGGGRPRVVRVDPSGAAGLPGNVLVVVRKVRPTPDRYPRPPGERRRAALLR